MCRTLTGTDVNSEIPTDYSVRVGRGNCAPATMILPNIAMKYSYLTQSSGETDWTGFFEEFEKTLVLTRTALIERFNYICSQSTNNAKYMYRNETMRGGKGDLDNSIYETMKH
jgi:ribonucleoside-triphosphate reductase